MVASPPDRFRLLYVCVANVCRSVLAERLTRHAIAVRLGGSAGAFEVASAGIEAKPGRPIHPYVRDALCVRGADPAGFASRRLTADLVDEADLVLAATGAERDRAITMAPAALRRTFTIREFARLAGPAEAAAPDLVGHARAAVAAAQRLRGRLPYVDPAGDDIPDPASAGAAFDACAAGLVVTLAPVLAALCPIRQSGRPPA
jgi:low molecular weight protein-tyrosine phosphatase